MVKPDVMAITQFKQPITHVVLLRVHSPVTQISMGSVLVVFQHNDTTMALI